MVTRAATSKPIIERIDRGNAINGFVIRPVSGCTSLDPVEGGSYRFFKVG